MEASGYAINLGMDPNVLLSQGTEDYIISVAMMQSALKLKNSDKIEEIKVLAELIGYEVAKTIAKIF